MIRRRRDTSPRSNMNNQDTSTGRRRTGRLPVFIASFLTLSIIVLFSVFFMSTLDVTKSGGRGSEIKEKASAGFNSDDENHDESGRVDSRTKSSRLPKKRLFTPAKDRTYTNAAEGSDCESFDHGDTSPTPGVKSMFNCNSKEGECKWHYPARFFDESCGIGKDYMEHIDVIKDLHAKNALWLSGPPIVIPWAAITPQLDLHKFRKEPFPTHNLSMTHVHKTGGTSLVNAFGSIPRAEGGKGKRHTVYQPGKDPNTLMRPFRNGVKPVNSTRIPPFQNKMHGQSTFHLKQYNESSKFLNGAVKYQSEWGLTDHTLFAVIRDPAERFISAIGQATGAYGSSGNGVGKLLLEECLKETSKETLSCFVDLVQNNGTLIEVHFTPMVYEISFATMWKDIPVAVFPFEQVPALMNELGANPHVKKKDGHSSGYRKSPVLTNMTYADYDEDILRKLCEIYWIDILFLRNLEYETHCDWMLDGKDYSTDAS